MKCPLKPLFSPPEIACFLGPGEAHEGVAEGRHADELHGQIKEVVVALEALGVDELLHALDAAGRGQVLDHHAGPGSPRARRDETRAFGMP